jgi:hypothetical protein
MAASITITTTTKAKPPIHKVAAHLAKPTSSAIYHLLCYPQKYAKIAMPKASKYSPTMRRSLRHDIVLLPTTLAHKQSPNAFQSTRKAAKYNV